MSIARINGYMLLVALGLIWVVRPDPLAMMITGYFSALNFAVDELIKQKRRAEDTDKA